MKHRQFSIENKCFALSGATGTLGGSISEYLVRNGAKVVLLGRSQEKLDKKVTDLKAITTNSIPSYVVDLLNEKELGHVRDKICSEVGTLNGLVNLAGGNIPGATLQLGQSIHNIEIGDIKKVVDLNLLGTVLPTIVLSELW